MADRTPRNENSGLIDLDALMREAESSRTLASASPTPSRAVPGPTPQPAPRAEDSLEGVATTLPASPPSETATVEDIGLAPRSERPTRPEGLRPQGTPLPTAPCMASRGRYGRIALAAITLVSAGVVALRSSRGTTWGAGSGTATSPTAYAVAAADTSVQGTVPAPLPVPAVSSQGAPVLAASLAESPLAAVAAGPRVHGTRSVAPAPRSSHDAVSAEGPTGIIAADVEPLAIVGGPDLGAAMRGAVGARDSRDGDGPAEPMTNARQLRPSPGAVVGAINAVLPQARACLGPDDPIRSGAIRFTSDGTVASVSLQGEKPVDGCIRMALSKARVAAFVDPTFTTRVTVRP